MKKSKHNKWADHYTLKAKREHFPARSVYKLKEIQKKYKIRLLASLCGGFGRKKGGSGGD